MKHKFLLVLLGMSFNIIGFSQTLKKTYYDYAQTKIDEEYYVNSKGEKHGKYKEYKSNGILGQVEIPAKLTT